MVSGPKFHPQIYVPYTADPFVLEPSPFKIEVAIEKLKIYKSPDLDQIPVVII
jgi:hypothetical protein